eukprot:4016523-Alexandrium_andersonii.AAC.1
MAIRARASSLLCAWCPSFLRCSRGEHETAQSNTVQQRSSDIQMRGVRPASPASLLLGGVGANARAQSCTCRYADSTPHTGSCASACHATNHNI